MVRVGILALACLLLAPSVLAQEPPDPSQAQNDLLYDFTMEASTMDVVLVPINTPGTIVFSVTDTSNDSPGQVAPGAPQYTPIPHRIDFEVEVLRGDASSWTIPTLAGFSQINAGDTKTTTLQATPGVTVSDPYLLLNVTAVMTVESGEFRRSTNVAFATHGLGGYALLQGPTLEVGPGELHDASFNLRNVGLLPVTYEFELIDNPCGVFVVPPGTATVQPQELRPVQFSIGTAEDRFWSNNLDCGLRFKVTPIDGPGGEKTAAVSMTVNGFYVAPEWIMTAVSIAALVLVLIIIVVRRKAIIEEELLGKPQRPWTIPVERVYLEHLHARDPRAAYVVRHFLMEEEYRSALLWYKSFKGATKGTRAKERIVVSAEKKYRRFQKKAERSIARPIGKADRFEAKLQKKLDRIAKQMVRKDRRGWRKASAKLEAAVEARNAKALAKWEKAAAKAEKKGQPVPTKPEVERPDIPPEPQLQKIHLENHKWNNKALRFRKKMVRKQGNLEVKFEKKEARVLRKVQRKVERIARKIDDPTFAAEHPLLQAAQK